MSMGQINSRNLVARLMELILLTSVVLALIGVVHLLFGDSSTQRDSVFFSLAVLVLLCSPLVVSLASAVYFIKERKRGMAAVALLLFLTLAVSVLNVV